MWVLKFSQTYFLYIYFFIVCCQLFDLCKSQQPSTNFESKVIALEGDVSELQMGLSENDYSTLTEKVNIVFHVAATVRFNESLPDAVKTNTRGTSQLVNLCLKMKSLQVKFI